jgi:hypothetical protein
MRLPVSIALASDRVQFLAGSLWPVIPPSTQLRSKAEAGRALRLLALLSNAVCCTSLPTERGQRSAADSRKAKTRDQWRVKWVK